MKIRHVDYSAGDMLSDITGELTPAEFGVYWMICTLIYRRREAVDDDANWLADKFRRSKTDPRTIRAAIDQLVRIGKVERSDGKLMVKRCRDEIELASNRIQVARENGSKGGRPSVKKKLEPNEINSDTEPVGSGVEKLTPTPTPVPEEEREAIASPKKKAPRSRIDPQRQPDEQDRKFAEERGVNVRQEWPRFINHHVSHGTLSADWHASWRTWCLNDVKFASERRATQTHHGKPGGSNGFVASLLDEIDGRGRGHVDQAPEPDDGGGPIIEGVVTARGSAA